MNKKRRKNYNNIYLWHKPIEKPKDGSIYVIRIFKNRRYYIDSGWYRSDNDYVALDETKIFWNEVYLWCYNSEFSRMIKTTFKKRQRIYHLRKIQDESTRIFN